jgi:UDP-N-acetylmuramoyl-tripeptide--D-alanyl-D-alanine ligase
MGVDHRGQTTRLCEIVHPDGSITSIGPDHLEFWRHGRIRTGEGGTAICCRRTARQSCADDPYFDYLAARARCRVVSFGLFERAHVRAIHVTSDARKGTTFGLLLPGKSRPTSVVIKVPGTHNVINALAAAAVGFSLNLPGVMIAQGLAKFRPAAMRSQVVTHHGVQIINDCYNANPASMKAALQLLGE